MILLLGKCWDQGDEGGKKGEKNEEQAAFNCVPNRLGQELNFVKQTALKQK